MKIPRQIVREILRIVKKLPPMNHKGLTESQTLSGLTLLRNGMKQINGRDIEAAGFYTITRPKPVNHRAELEAAYRSHGMDGVHSYVKGVVDACKK